MRFIRKNLKKKGRKKAIGRFGCCLINQCGVVLPRPVPMLLEVVVVEARTPAQVKETSKHVQEEVESKVEEGKAELEEATKKII